MNIEDCIFYQLSRASRAGARHWHKKAADFGVTSSQALVLMFLQEQDKVTSKLLGTRTQFDSATLTGIIDRLEKAALAERRSNPEDRRAIRVCLTPAGKKTAGQLRAIVEQENKAFLHGLTPEESMILKALLKKVG